MIVVLEYDSLLDYENKRTHHHQWIRTMNLEQLWTDLQQEIKEILGVNKYEIWIQKGSDVKLRLMDSGPNWILFETNNDFFAQHVEKHIWLTLSDLFLAMCGHTIEFRYRPSIESEALHEPIEQTVQNNHRKMIQPRRILDGIPADKLFDNFVVGSCNSFAHAAAMAVAESLGDTQYNPLYMYGSTGLGKTHLMLAIANEVAQQDHSITPLYITAESFINDMISHLRTRRMNEFKIKYRENCSLLLMDDIQFLSNKNQMQEELFHTFEYLKNQGHQIVFTSDVLPKDIEGLMERLSSRFQSGMIADLQAPDMETVLAIIQQKAERMGAYIPNDVSQYVAEHAQGNVREVEGSLNKLVGYAKLRKVRISLELAKRELRHIFQEKATAPLAPDNVISSISSTFNIETSHLLGRSRKAKFSLPRQVAMYILKEYSPLSTAQIGQFLNGRDHSTVIHGHSKIKDKLSTDPSLKQTVDLIKRDLQIWN